MREDSEKGCDSYRWFTMYSNEGKIVRGYSFMLILCLVILSSKRVWLRKENS